MLYLRKFHDGSIYHYYFIIKELAEEFEGQITCLGKNTEKLKNFSVPIEKVTRNQKGNELTKTLSCRLYFIDSERFMLSLLSNFANKCFKCFIKSAVLNTQL